MAGFHRMAYGNAVNIAEFNTSAEAQQTARVIGTSTGWQSVGEIIPGLPAWQADQPTDEIMPTPLRKITVAGKDKFLIRVGQEKAKG